MYERCAGPGGGVVEPPDVPHDALSEVAAEGFLDGAADESPQIDTLSDVAGEEFGDDDGVCDESMGSMALVAKSDVDKPLEDLAKAMAAMRLNVKKLQQTNRRQKKTSRIWRNR